MTILELKNIFIAMFDFEKVQTSDQQDSIYRISETLAENIINVGLGTEILVSLPLSGWVGNTQTVAATGVTATNDVWIYPPSNYVEGFEYIDCKIWCTAQGENTLTFQYGIAPTSDINNVIVGIK